LILYLFLIGSMRLLGKRQLGQMEATEFVVTMLVANLASVPIEDPSIPVHHGIASIVVVIALEMLFATISLHNIRFRRFLCGKPVILIENGKILYDSLKKTRITLDELSSQLRLKNVLDIRMVQYAILETNGNLSVFPFPEEVPATAADAGITPTAQSLPVTIISDGRLLKTNLQKAGKDEFWLRRVLTKRKLSRRQVLLLTVDGLGNILCIPKES
jgi:uncharacterized membrane protein YcaP (DUF421 family)